jgi:hypothetical protein
LLKIGKKIEKLNQIIKEKWNIELPLKEVRWEIREERPSYRTTLSHRDYQEMIKEIGKLQGFIAEMEYPMEGEKLDVVWRRVVGSVPTYVFEIQIGGDVYHALGKLKHAWDLWNSNIFLITDKESIPKIQTY